MLEDSHVDATRLADGFLCNSRRFLSRFPGVVDLAHAV